MANVFHSLSESGDKQLREIESSRGPVSLTFSLSYWKAHCRGKYMQLVESDWEDSIDKAVGALYRTLKGQSP